MVYGYRRAPTRAQGSRPSTTFYAAHFSELSGSPITHLRHLFGIHPIYPCRQRTEESRARTAFQTRTMVATSINSNHASAKARSSSRYRRLMARSPASIERTRKGASHRRMLLLITGIFPSFRSACLAVNVLLAAGEMPLCRIHMKHTLEQRSRHFFG